MHAVFFGFAVAMLAPNSVRIFLEYYAAVFGIVIVMFLRIQLFYQGG